MNVLRNRLTASDDVESQPVSGDTAVSTTYPQEPPATLVEALCALFVIAFKFHLGNTDTEPELEGTVTRSSARAEENLEYDGEDRNIVANVVAHMMGYLQMACSFLSSSRPEYDVERAVEEAQPDDRHEAKRVRFDHSMIIDMAGSSSDNEDCDDSKEDDDDDDDDDDEEEVKITPLPPRRQRKPLAFEPSSSRKFPDWRHVDTIFAAISHMQLDRQCTQLERIEAATIRMWHGSQFVADMLRVRRIIQCRNISAMLHQEEKWKRHGSVQEKTAALKEMLIRRAREVVGELTGEDERARVFTDEEMKTLAFFKMSPEVSSTLNLSES
ncbi:hypothetical protein V1520DRAFT_290451 [Lipomyces starkeyi]|uniref:Uncharacterized protein n=1 Tax=Lipomyces starkeyi NRRL Y-11557 TaxID=675824 RepID=A0A1E3QF37_LIPST|nr:hypothetical protein LIPSTDRAFT_129548 [Lipomyces starkeyi NRRL Y-11557]